MNEWKNGKMEKPRRLFTSWQTEVFSLTYQILNYISATSLRTTLEKYVYTDVAQSFLTTVACEAYPIFQTQEVIDCDCNGFNGTKYESGYCFQNAISFQVGQQFFCRGKDKRARIGKFHNFFFFISYFIFFYLIIFV